MAKTLVLLLVTSPYFFLKVEVTEDFKKAIAKLKSSSTLDKRFMYIVEEAYGSEIETLKKQYEHASFNFVEFVNHVLWTKKMGLTDHHWVPQSELCNVCNKKYKYIMKLDSINEEFPFFLEEVGYQRAKHPLPPFIETHNSTKKGFVKKASYIDYYRNVPLDIMNKILDLYKYDFLLFGFSI